MPVTAPACFASSLRPLGNFTSTLCRVRGAVFLEVAEDSFYIIQHSDICLLHNTVRNLRACMPRYRGIDVWLFQPLRFGIWATMGGLIVWIRTVPSHLRILGIMLNILCNDRA